MCFCFVNEQLQAHSAEFDKEEVIEVIENVFLAIGFGLANSMMVVGPEGVVIVDTMESVHAAERVLEAFRPYMQGKPIVSCIYSHNHADHVMGTSVFCGKNDSTKIWAHELCNYYMERIITKTGETTYRRGMRQFGVYVPEDQFENSGIGPFLDTKTDEPMVLKFPTHTFKEERKAIVEGGVRLELIHCPGETNDQICVFLPDHNVLYGADNIYKAFPNIYAIRGTPSRDAMQWVESLDRMAQVNADILVLGHTRPIVGAATVRDTIEIYRDAIQFVHDQTIRLMNLGLFLDQIVERVKLPDEMRNHEFLQEYYGTVEWAVRAIFTHYLGWFGGDPINLRPLKMKTKVKMMTNLAGGEGKLLQHAIEALDQSTKSPNLEEKREYAQWALELFDIVLKQEPANERALDGKVKSLQVLGSCQISANGRNYYLTFAQETKGTFKLRSGPQRLTGAMESARSLKDLMQLLSVRLDPGKVGADTKFTASFHVAESRETVLLHFRRGICISSSSHHTFGVQRISTLVANGWEPNNHDANTNLDVQVEIDTISTWKNLLTGKANPVKLFQTQRIKCTPDASPLLQMMSWFTRQPSKL